MRRAASELERIGSGETGSPGSREDWLVDPGILEILATKFSNHIWQPLLARDKHFSLCNPADRPSRLFESPDHHRSPLSNSPISPQPSKASTSAQRHEKSRRADSFPDISSDDLAEDASGSSAAAHVHIPTQARLQLSKTAMALRHSDDESNATTSNSTPPKLKAPPSRSVAGKRDTPTSGRQLLPGHYSPGEERQKDKNTRSAELQKWMRRSWLAYICATCMVTNHRATQRSFTNESMSCATESHERS